MARVHHAKSVTMALVRCLGGQQATLLLSVCRLKNHGPRCFRQPDGSLGPSTCPQPLTVVRAVLREHHAS